MDPNDKRTVQQVIASTVGQLYWQANYDVRSIDATDEGKVIVTTQFKTVTISIEMEDVKK